MRADKDPSVLIVTASFGAGHTSVSNSLREAFVARGVTRVSILDFYELVSPFFNKVSRFVYSTGTTWTPALYGAAYKKVDALPPDSWVHAAADRFGREELASKVTTEEPDIVLFTYPAPGGVLTTLRRKRLFSGMLATVITDYSVHSGWLHNPVDLYLVATNEIKTELVKRGIDRARVEISGIPIDISFGGMEKDTGNTSGVPVVIFAAHGYRTNDAFNVACSLSRSAPAAKIVVLYRGNDMLARRLGEVANGGNIELVSFAPNLGHLMSRADVMVSKAGGLTMTEAMVSGLPVVVWRPVPGQEAENTRFMVRAGAALTANTISELAAAVGLILSDPVTRESMRSAARRTVRRGSADRAVSAVLQRFVETAPQEEAGETNAATRKAGADLIGQLWSRP